MSRFEIGKRRAAGHYIGNLLHLLSLRSKAGYNLFIGSQGSNLYRKLTHINPYRHNRLGRMKSVNNHYLTSEISQDCITEESHHHRVSQSPDNPVNRKGTDDSDGRNMVPVESSSHDSKGQNDSESSGSYEEDPSNSDPGEGIKLFVGQVPKTMEETDLFPILEKFGPMENITIIRDSNTGQHRGCAFVTFLKKESAEACQNELHDKVILDGGKKPVQVKPAGKKEGK